MEENLVSVVVPSYNYENYIVECLESIRNQEYKKIELVIIDDCSKDSSKELIRNFIYSDRIKERFWNVVYIEHDENKGAHYTINEGIEKSQGDYIAVINADDLYEKDRFTKMIPKMKKENAIIAFSNIEIINGDSKLAKGIEADNFRGIQKSIKESEVVSYALMHQNVAISTGNMVFTKELYYKLKGFREYKYIHDWDFILRASLIKEPLYIDDTKYYYRLHEDNSFRELGDIADQEVNEVLNNFFSQIRINNVNNTNLSKKLVYNKVENTYLKRYWFRIGIISRITNILRGGK
ncbi:MULTISPECIES: glycosyltransferase family 2 protein [Clostridium]|uniref:glycosyltransferase family 2 protein n=1 Tax=Clostridium TaxID=1485 RepID=UPI0005EAF50B|nr:MULTISPECIES: glycosyltransferase family 2 protein [Clostridium]MDU4853876.1 glycosyltransferase family 2 protein [Clostridioides difficile]MDB2158897.1 glycosyltransferase family 2 protein [Clostridium butyricum]MDU1403288.1 glycosyltransferase family 2 protein [Clostridium sp.]MDU4752170.1 glycosyltransferase family 2 protein [Clostridium butyricum]MDU4926838.1 glycosyltransferase family 2 protein [Clostridium sp.]